MRTGLIILCLVFLVACGPKELPDVPTTTSQDVPEGCYIMKRADVNQYACFGCVDGEQCREPDFNEWILTEQSAASEVGLGCEPTQFGCELVVS